MFYECSNLKSFPEFEYYDGIYLECDDSQESEKSNKFYPTNERSKISSIRENQNSSGKKAMNEIYNKLSLLKTLKITNISYMFYGCELLDYLPSSLSIWNTVNSSL